MFLISFWCIVFRDVIRGDEILEDGIPPFLLGTSWTLLVIIGLAFAKTWYIKSLMIGITQTINQVFVADFSNPRTYVYLLGVAIAFIVIFNLYRLQEQAINSFLRKLQEKLFEEKSYKQLIE